MKNILFGITLFFASTALGQKPEAVYSIALEVRELSWYEQQMHLWKAEIDKNKQNGTAWTNYYMAARALRNLSRDNEAQFKTYQDKCAAIVSELHEAYPNSFEDHYMTYVNSGFKETDALLKAVALNPYDSRILDEMLIYDLIHFNNTGFQEYAKRMYEVNHLPAGVLNWGHNQLAELDQNAILFTFGDNDSYSIWINQGAFGFRKDVTCVNTSLILMDDYRNKLFELLGIAPLKITLEEAGSAEVFSKRIFQHIFDSNKPVYVSNSGITHFPEVFKSNLYLTGLSYKYSTTNLETESLIVRNYEKRYALDYLNGSFSYHFAQAKVDEFNGIYLPSLIKLYNYYTKTEQISKQAEIEQLILKISEKTGQQSEVVELLQLEDKQAPLLFTLLDLKTLEKTFAPLSKNLYVGKFEVKQGDYNLFLENLKRSGNTELYNMCLYDSTQWKAGVLAHDFNDPMMNLYHWHPAYQNYPIVNISYEAAKAYCQWLTDQYNAQRKRNYTQVLFRLPTPEEWRTAAGSGNPKALTPFSNDSFKSSEKGCWLANVQPEKGKFYDDGGFHTVRVESYTPNNFGLYNTFGNVSEMTSQKGTALGGSWFSLPEECYFNLVQSYSGPNPFTGFRIVMEIIQE